MPTWYIAGNERRRGAVIAGSGGGPSSIVTDGVFSSSGTGSSFSTNDSGGVNLTTTLANDTIVAFVSNDRTAAQGSSATVVSVVGSTVGSLTFYARKQATTSGGDFLNVEIWYGTAASSVVNESFITTFTSATDNCGISGMAFHGVNLTGQLDANGSLPATASDVAGSGGSIPTVGSVSTTKSHTVLIGGAMFAAGSNTNAQNAGTGYTAIDNLTPQAGSLFSKMSTEYQTTEATSPQSGQTVAFNAVWANWAMIVAALVDNNAV